MATLAPCDFERKMRNDLHKPMALEFQVRKWIALTVAIHENSPRCGTFFKHLLTRDLAKICHWR